MAIYINLKPHGGIRIGFQANWDQYRCEFRIGPTLMLLPVTFH